MKNIISLFFLLVSILHFSGIMAQELSVKDCKLMLKDNYAETHVRKDPNDKICAVLMIYADNIQGIEFPSKKQYVSKEYKDGVYYVHVPVGAYRLNFQHKDFQPGIIDMYEGFSMKAKEGKTYKIVLEAANPKNKRSGAVVAFKINPKVKGIVEFDNKVKSIPDDGQIEFESSLGSYNYAVSSENYERATGTVNVNAKTVLKNITLRHKMTDVQVECNITEAHVFVDNIDYGKVGLKQLPVGKHNIRVSNEGFIDYTEDIQISESTASISCELKKNKGKRVDIHATPVTIKSTSSRIYKNNKVIEEWKDGAVILFTPGVKCKLSTDAGNGMWFTAGYEPMTITVFDTEIKIEDGKQSRKLRR